MSLPTLGTFPLNPDGGYEYRPLKRDPAKPMQKGWDVYAVQTAFLGVGYSFPKFGADGYAGDEFATTVWRFQQSRADLVDDGICGIATQRALGIVLIERLARQYNIAPLLLNGQIEQESGWQLGNYTPVYPQTGKRDLGPAQINLAVTDENCRFAFDTRLAFGMIAGHPDRGLRNRKDKYKGQPGALDDRRAWELASGSWNQPSTADYVAKHSGSVGNTKFEEYIDACTKYVTNWIP